jgi:phosphotransferase system HPr (HPr) family protein
MLSVRNPYAQPVTEPASSTRVIVVTDPDGLNLRNCAAFVKVVQQHRAEVIVWENGRRVNAASILELMSLAAISGTSLTVSATGPTSNEVLEAIVRVLEREEHGTIPPPLSTDV